MESHKNKERMANLSFRIMTFIMKAGDIFSDPGRKLDEFGINMGDTVIDYGCGPARYLKRASDLAGDTGLVYAVDIHELSIDAVNKLISRLKLKNVVPVLCEGYNCPLDSGIADIVYALDMFHMIQDTKSFLSEIRRLLKRDGILILENGHQSRVLAKEKITSSKKFRIIEENKKFLKCLPA